ncbi:MAG: hypothetical protein V4671_23090 [Armatimonadota bacterium]
MMSQSDLPAGDGSIGDAGNGGSLTSGIVNSDIKGATLNTDKSTENSGGSAIDDGKDYIGSLPDKSGLGATGIRDITTTEEEDARAAQVGGDPDVAT